LRMELEELAFSSLLHKIVAVDAIVSNGVF
jgi:hypothetical protein